jgi:hypothetical protein
MIDPGLSETREGVRVGMEDGVRLDDELSRTQMPPHVGIRHTARGHAEQTQGKNDHEQATGLKDVVQCCVDDTVPSSRQYRIASRASELFRMESSKLKTACVLYLAGTVALNALILWQLRGSILQGYSDFTALYTAGKLVQQGRASAIYDRRVQWEVQQEFAFAVKIRRGPLPYIRPPFEALLFWPLAHLRYPVACLLWMAFKVVILFAIPFVLQPIRGEPRVASSALGGLLGLAFFPVVFDLLQGQDAILLLLVLVLMLNSLQRKADFQSGMLLGLGLFKFHLIVPIALVFLLRRKNRVVLGVLTTALVLVLVSVLTVGWATLLAYPRYVWDLNRTSGVGVTTATSMPNLRGLLAAFGVSQTSVLVTWFLWAVEIGGVIFTACIWRPGGDNDHTLVSLGFSLSIVVTLLTSYYVYSYDLTLLLIPILQFGGFFLRGLKKRRWPDKLFVGCLALLLLTPIHWIVIFRFGRFYWIALVLLLMAVSIACITESRRNSRVSADDPFVHTIPAS